MAQKRTAKKSDTRFEWMLPSNHQNVLYMLGMGLITGPGGFEYGGESKYFKDALSLCPDWIPLFRNRIPDDLLSMATEEGGNLLTVVAHIDMSDYQGRVRFNCEEKWELMPIHDLPDATDMILVRAPLPASWISKIAFKNETEKSGFESLAKSFANTNISMVELAVLPDLINNQFTLLPQINSARDAIQTFENVDESDGGIISTERAQALGGILTMLYRLANHSDVCLDIYREVRHTVLNRNENLGYAEKYDDPVISRIPYWLRGESIPKDDTRSIFFFGLLDDIIANRNASTQQELTTSSRAYVLRCVKELQENWKMLPRLLEELSSPELTLSMQFEKYKGTVSHALLLFFQRENCEDLLRFQIENPMIDLSDYDVVAAALLFGARDGWIGMPKDCRIGLSGWITSMMASIAHANDKQAIQIFDKYPVPLREYFSGDEWKVNCKHALDLARKRKWGECIQTRIKVPKSYQVEEGYLVLPGDIKGNAIITEVDQDKLLYRLRELPAEDEQLVRVKIKGLVE